MPKIGTKCPVLFAISTRNMLSDVDMWVSVAGWAGRGQQRPQSAPPPPSLVVFPVALGVPHGPILFATPEIVVTSCLKTVAENLTAEPKG